MKTIRLLTVGNSFSRNALRFLPDIADSSGSVKFDIATASLGGCSLEKHFNLAKLSERLPDFPTYAVGVVDSVMQEMSLVKALAWKRWDCE